MFAVVVGRWPQAGAFYDTTRQEAGATCQDLPGLGDRAFIDLTGGTAVAVVEGDLYLAITFIAAARGGGAAGRPPLPAVRCPGGVAL